MEVLQQETVIYLVVFLAIVLPVLLWHKEDGVAGGAGQGWNNLPSLFRTMWRTMVALESAVGGPMARMFPEKAKSYSKAIMASGLPLTPERIFAMQIVSLLGGLAMGLVMLLVPDMNPLWAGLLAPALAVVAFIYPGMALDKYVEWRKTELTRELPFAIDLIGSAMRAGLEFGAAMRYFVELKMPGPLTEEFEKVLRQIELGKTRVEALSDMAARIQVDAFSSFVGVVAYGTEIGASISETLAVHGEELRRARFHLAERRAARAPSLMILPMAVFIMPAVFIIVIVPVMLKMSGTGIGGH